MISKKTTEKQKLACFSSAHVDRAHDFGNGSVSFTCTFGGSVTVYNMRYREGTREDGTEYAFVSFPQYKGSDGKYYNIVYTPLTDALQKDIIKQLEDLLK